MPNDVSEEWGTEIDALEKEVACLEEAREEALSLMRSYEVFAKCEYGYGVWKETGPSSEVGRREEQDEVEVVEVVKLEREGI